MDQAGLRTMAELEEATAGDGGMLMAAADTEAKGCEAAAVSDAGTDAGTDAGASSGADACAEAGADESGADV